MSEYISGGCSITKHPINRHDPESEGKTALRLNILLDQKGTGYVNPEYTVIPLEGTTREELVVQARRAHVLWVKRLRRIVRSSYRRKAIRKRASYMEVQLAHFGILCINGEIQAPESWCISRKTKKRELNAVGPS